MPSRSVLATIAAQAALVTPSSSQPLGGHPDTLTKYLVMAMVGHVEDQMLPEISATRNGMRRQTLHGDGPHADEDALVVWATSHAGEQKISQW